MCAIDGSLFEIPKTKELRREYKTQKKVRVIENPQEYQEYMM